MSHLKTFICHSVIRILILSKIAEKLSQVKIEDWNPAKILLYLYKISQNII